MPKAVLTAHAGARLVSRDVLMGLPEPPSLGRNHMPVHHGKLVEKLAEAFRKNGLRIAREEFALQHGAAVIFGVFDLEPARNCGLTTEDARDGMGWAFGFRGANDKSMRLSAVAGSRVFVCDNLAMSGEMIVLARKHTALLDLDAEVQGAVARYLSAQRKLVGLTDRARDMRLEREMAKLLIFDAFAEARVMPTRHFQRVANNYFKPTPDMTDCQGESLWALFNAFTREARTMAPMPKFEASRRIGRYLLGKLDVPVIGAGPEQHDGDEDEGSGDDTE